MNKLLQQNLKLISQRMRFSIRCLIIFLCYVTSAHAVLSQQELKMRDEIIKQQPATIKLLKNLVNINSGTNNINGVQQVGNKLLPLLHQLGFKTTWYSEPSSFHRAPTLVARRVGHHGKRLLLIGHLDTVFQKDNSFQHFSMKTNTAKGPGVIDDKGGMVVMLSALKALAATHSLHDVTITIVLTGDEEESGKPAIIARQPLIKAAHESDIALDFEPTMTLNTASISRRGIALWCVTTTGNESHSATIFTKDVGSGAIFELARILESMRTTFMDEKYLSFNPGVVAGGNQIIYDEKIGHATANGKLNVVAKTAKACGDFRFLDATQKNNFEQNFTNIVTKHLPGTEAKVDYVDSMPAMPPTENNENLLKQYSEVSEDMGTGKVSVFDPGARGAGDISYIANIVSANLVGLGPMGMGTHTKIETLDLHSLPIQTERAAILIYRLTSFNAQ